MRGETHNKILVYEIELEMLCVWLPGSHLKLEVAFKSFSPSLLHPYCLECEYNGWCFSSHLGQWVWRSQFRHQGRMVNCKDYWPTSKFLLLQRKITFYGSLSCCYLGIFSLQNLIGNWPLSYSGWTLPTKIASSAAPSSPLKYSEAPLLPSWNPLQSL